MNAFEKWAEGLLDQDDENPEKTRQMIHEREYYATRHLTPEEIKKRWEKINYTPEPVQFKLF